MGLTQNLGRLSPSIFSDSSLNIGVGAAPSGSYKFEITGTSKVSGVLTLGATLSNGTYTYTLPAATGTLALVGGAGVGTVTSVAALTLGTTGTDLSSTVATSTTTPVITLNVPTASAANRGALSSADWTTFNSKQSTITLTTTGTSGAATFSSNTLNIPNYGSALTGYVPYTGATAAVDLGSNTLQVNEKIGTADNKGIYLRGIADSTHRLYYNSTLPGIVLEINNAFRIQYYNAGTPSTQFTFGTTGNLDAEGRGTFGTGLNILGLGGMYNAANKFGLDQYGAISRFYSNGPNTTTAGQYEFHVNSSNGTIDTIGLYIGNTGNVGIRIAASTASDTYLKTGDAGIAYQNTYFGTGQVRIGGGSDHVANVVLSVAPGVINFDRPGVGGGAFKVHSDGKIGINAITNNGFQLEVGGTGKFSGSVGIKTSPTQPLTVNQETANAYNQGIPATSGSTQNGILRLQPSSSIFGETFDFGMNVGPTYAWIQATNAGGLGTNYNLALNPNGGNVLIGTTTDDTVNKLQVNGNIAINKGAANTAIFDTNNTRLSLATGGTADFTNYSGMILVTSFQTGSFQILVCGGGSTASVYLLGGAMGVLTYNAGINGYTYTITAVATSTYNFTAFRTRPDA